MLPDFRVRQRDYLLEIARLLTQELDLEKLLARILRVSIEMLAGQAGLIALKETEGWRVAAAHRIQPAFLSYLEPLLAEGKDRDLDVSELNRMLKDIGEAHPSVGDTRSIGLFGILELVKDRSTKEPMAPWNSTSPEMNALRKHCLENGLFLYTHWHTVLIIPPLIITEEQLEEGFSVIDKSLEITDKATA